MNGDIEIFTQPEKQEAEKDGNNKIRKRTIYAIGYGIGGLVIGYFVHSLALFLAWLLFLGDGPTSLGQDIVAYIFVFGTTIGFWLIVVHFGYHQGIEAENSIDHKPVHSIGKIFLRVILVIIVGTIILSLVIYWNMMHDKKARTLNSNITTSNSTNPDQQRYDIMNWMTSAWTLGHDCMGASKSILSGNGGDKICDIPGHTWPIIKACGANPIDTQWVVQNEKNSNWIITLNCVGVTACNGQTNAYCNDNGCTFNKGCDPRKK